MIFYLKEQGQVSGILSIETSIKKIEKKCNAQRVCMPEKDTLLKLGKKSADEDKF